MFSASETIASREAFTPQFYSHCSPQASRQREVQFEVATPPGFANFAG
jgi:hypothetical protein